MRSAFLSGAAFQINAVVTIFRCARAISFCYYFLYAIAKTKGSFHRVLILYLKLQLLTGLLALSGCASKVTQPDVWILKNYSDLRETTSATGNRLRWSESTFPMTLTMTVLFTIPITYYPVPANLTEVRAASCDKLLACTNTKVKPAIEQRRPLVRRQSRAV